MRLCTLLFYLLLLSAALPAQQARWEGGALAGMSGYQGELSASLLPELDETGPMYGFLLRRHLSPRWALRADVAYATLQGSDADLYPQRSYTFESTFVKAGLVAEWEPWGHLRYPGPRQFRARLSPYLFAGLGGLYYEAAPDFSRTTQETAGSQIQADQSVSYPRQQFTLPVGAGVKLDLSRRMVVGVELATLTAFSDYLDGISQAGNPSTNDWLPSAAVTLTMRILPKDSDRDGIADEEDACPRVRGVWSARGCPDQDGDGVEDLEDICPELAGSPLLNGCPDADRDGVADRDDECPYQVGTIATGGCPDYDLDGLADAEDPCPRLPGSPGGRGCPTLDTDADGDLQDEPTICQPNPGLQFIQRIRSSTAASFELVRYFCPPVTISKKNRPAPVLPKLDELAAPVFSF